MRRIYDALGENSDKPFAELGKNRGTLTAAECRVDIRACRLHAPACPNSSLGLMTSKLRDELLQHHQAFAIRASMTTPSSILERRETPAPRRKFASCARGLGFDETSQSQSNCSRARRRTSGSPNCSAGDALRPTVLSRGPHAPSPCLQAGRLPHRQIA